MPFFGFTNPLGNKTPVPVPQAITTPTTSSSIVLPTIIGTGTEPDPFYPKPTADDQISLAPPIDLGSHPSSSSKESKNTGVGIGLTSRLRAPRSDRSSSASTTQPQGKTPRITSTPASPVAQPPIGLTQPVTKGGRDVFLNGDPTSHTVLQDGRTSSHNRPNLQPRTVSHASRSSAASSFHSHTANSSRSSLALDDAGRGGTSSERTVLPISSKGGEDIRRGRKRSGVTTIDPTLAESTDALGRQRESTNGIGAGTLQARPTIPGGVTKEDEEERRRAERRRVRRVERKAAKDRDLAGAVRPGSEERAERVDHDTYVIVRPPASNTKRPLNLQIQLVLPARARARGSSRSSGGNGSELGMGLGGGRATRSPSGASNTSGMSLVTTATSLSTDLPITVVDPCPELQTTQTDPGLASEDVEPLSPNATLTTQEATLSKGAIESWTLGLRSPTLDMCTGVSTAAGGFLSSAWAGLGLSMPLASTMTMTTGGDAKSIVDFPIAVAAHDPGDRLNAAVTPSFVSPELNLPSIRERPDSNASTKTAIRASGPEKLRKVASESAMRDHSPPRIGTPLGSPTRGILLPAGGVVSPTRSRATYATGRAPSDSGSTTSDRAVTAGPKAGLSRSGSVKSELSSAGLSGLGSAVAGGSSTSSAAGRPRSFSGASLANSQNGGSGRRIVPLWNLSVHNVIQTNVTDAGTDAKVAKFTKRAIEVVDVGSLEPVEFHGSRTPSLMSAINVNPLSAQSTRTTNTSFSAGGPVVGEARASPDKRSRSNSTLSASADVRRTASLFSPSRAPARSMDQRPTELLTISDGPETGKSKSQIPEPFAGTKKIFGRLFKKKDDIGSGQNMDGSLASPASVRSMSTFQGDAPSPISLRSTMHAGILPIDAIPLGAPTFGCQPGIVGSAMSGRARSYSFTVRKWALAKIGSSLQPLILAPRLADSADVQDLDVSIEWVKSRSASRQTEAALERTASPGAFTSDVATSIPRNKPLRDRRVSLTESSMSPRASLDVPRTDSPSKMTRRRPTSMISAQGSSSIDGNEGEESDPEDSETPWHCVVRCPGTASRSERGRRAIHVIATLYPAPHHPRVVGQIKVPIELSSIATGLVKPLTDTSISAELEEVWLSDENLKDIISSTAMWLVVREEFGGLGKRKKL